MSPILFEGFPYCWNDFMLWFPLPSGGFLTLEANCQSVSLYQGQFNGSDRRFDQPKKPDLSEQKQCNCRKNNPCLTENLIYQASVLEPTNNVEGTYVGLSAPSFKLCLANPKKSVNIKFGVNHIKIILETYQIHMLLI